ncbi:MAG: CRISPR-associated endonuclease Cas1 [Deltaproteobacteria bacterium]|nr:CRISPR-associated endonuclease Cas1 [Deltaproteobacteria bacterium]
MIAYLSEQGSRVGKKRGRLIVRKGRDELLQLKVFELDQLVLLGHIQLSSAAIRALLQAGIDTVFLTRSGRFLGRLSSGMTANIELRLHQFRTLTTEDRLLDLARRYVRGKLRNSVALLRRHNRSLRNDAISRATTAIRHCIIPLDSCKTADEIRGHEGAGAAQYFGALSKIIRAPGFSFEKRLRRPPPDPINIILSLGYTLLTNIVHGLCEQAGLDPYLGALHAPHYGRPSLPLDLIEEFRPVLVDAPMLRAIHTRAIVPTDFERVEDAASGAEDQLWRDLDAAVEEEAAQADAEHLVPPEEIARGAEEALDLPPPRQVLLTQLGLKKWFMAFERRLEERALYPPRDQRLSYRQILREQVYAFARHVRGDDTYEPFEYRR